jgi:hypothetical protein
VSCPNIRCMLSPIALKGSALCSCMARCCATDIYLTFSARSMVAGYSMPWGITKERYIVRDRHHCTRSVRHFSARRAKEKQQERKEEWSTFLQKSSRCDEHRYTIPSSECSGGSVLSLPLACFNDASALLIRGEKQNRCSQSVSTHHCNTQKTRTVRQGDTSWTKMQGSIKTLCVHKTFGAVFALISIHPFASLIHRRALVRLCKCQ